MKPLLKLVFVLWLFFTSILVLLKVTGLVTVEKIKLWLELAREADPIYAALAVIGLLFVDLFIAECLEGLELTLEIVSSGNDRIIDGGRQFRLGLDDEAEAAINEGGRHCFDRRIFKKHPQGDLTASRAADASNDSGSQQGMAAEEEEIVIDRNPLDSQYLSPNRC